MLQYSKQSHCSHLEIRQLQCSVVVDAKSSLSALLLPLRCACTIGKDGWKVALQCTNTIEYARQVIPHSEQLAAQRLAELGMLLTAGQNTPAFASQFHGSGNPLERGGTALVHKLSWHTQADAQIAGADKQVFDTLDGRNLFDAL
jgi:hypothetical protein